MFECKEKLQLLRMKLIFKPLAFAQLIVCIYVGKLISTHPCCLDIILVLLSRNVFIIDFVLCCSEYVVHFDLILTAKGILLEFIDIPHEVCHLI